MIILIGLIIGLIIGLFLQVDIPPAYSAYVAVVILAALDALVGGLNASMDDSFQTRLFVTGLLGNSLIAIVMVALGDRLNVALDLAAVIVFGTRMFNNFASIRRRLLERQDERNRLRSQLSGSKTGADQVAAETPEGTQGPGEDVAAGVPGEND